MVAVIYACLAIVLAAAAVGNLLALDTWMRVLVSVGCFVGSIASLLTAVTYALNERQRRRHAREYHQWEMGRLAIESPALTVGGKKKGRS